MKILYVLHQFFPLHHTGTERLTLDISKQMQRMGNFVTVLTYQPNPPLEKHVTSKSKNKNQLSFDEGFQNLKKNLMRKDYQVDSVPVIAFKHKKHTWGYKIFDHDLEEYLADIVKKFDLVHITHPMRFASLIKVCLKFNIPTVLTLTDPWLICPRALVTSDFELCDGPDEGRKCMKLCHYDKSVLTRYEDSKFFYENVTRIFSGSEFLKRTFLENNLSRSVSVFPF